MNVTKLNPRVKIMHSILLLSLFALAVPSAEKPLADALVLWPKTAIDTDPKLAGAQMLPKELAGKAMSVSVKLRTSAAGAPVKIIGWKGRGDRPAVRLFSEQAKSNLFLRAELSTDARNRPLQLSVPFQSLGVSESQLLVLRYSGARLELFADGVLVDEEWPLGSLLPAESGLEIGAAVEQVAIWNRALSDDEVLQLSGGREGLSAREQNMLGRQLPIGQYWKPRGFNVHVGDCMPFFHQGRFHLFYLFDRRHHASKWGLGAHQWAHVSTTDLRQWEHHPMAISITDQMEGSICTGSTFFHEDVYYAFYAVRMSDGSPAQLCAATSTDGVHFKKNPPLATLKEPYQPGPGRDPVVFRHPATGLFHMLVTTELANPPVPGRGGCLAQLVSPDLKKWEQREPFLVPGYPGQPECPDYFLWNGWYYLVFSNDGVARYRMSRGPLGPWLRPVVDVFDGPRTGVLKTAAFTGDRRIGAAFLVSPDGYGGELIFREVFQHPDGTLGTRWPAELVPPADELLSLTIVPLTSGVSGDAKKLGLNAPQDLVMASLASAPREFLLRARVNPGTNASWFGLRIGATKDGRGGHEIRFEPRREKMGLRPSRSSTVDENESTSIYDVTGLGQSFELEVIVRGEIVDVCVDKRRTLAARIPAMEGGHIFAFAQNAEVIFENLELRPLLNGEPRR
jgi:beta-fructofuranosidase